MEALVYALKAITKPGDLIAIESPTYFGIVTLIRNLGLRTLEIPADPVGGIDLDRLKKVLDNSPVAACLFVPTFSNPMGYCMSNEQKKKLVQILFDYQVPLIEDDIYGEMYFGKSRPRTCKSFDENGMVLLCSSYSKSLAPGYRVGWCLPGKFKEEIIRLKLISTVSSATPTQHAIAKFFQTGRYDLHMRNLRRILHGQCLRYTQAIAEYFPDDTKVSRPLGGYVLWLEFPLSVKVIDIFYLAAEARISIAPGQLFSRDSRFTNYMRISFGIPYNRVIDDSLKLLGNMIKNQLVAVSLKTKAV
jgi:DNA-binding transcriptional MocR family regulator